MNEHQSRFKTYLLDSSSLRDEATKLSGSFAALEHLRLKLTDPEFVLTFICLYLETRRPGDWAMKHGTAFELKSPCLYAEYGKEFSFLEQLASSGDDLLSRYEFKKLPGSILNALRQWRQSNYRLRLFSRPVTPFEMLALQACGERAVTLDLESAQAGLLVDGRRDAFEFLLHDLVHADLYYTEGHNEQRDFFHSVLKVVEKNKAAILADFENDREFERDFFYLVSDMNSNVHHLTAHLVAALTKNELVRCGLSPRDTLSEEGRRALAQRLAHWQFLGGFQVPLMVLEAGSTPAPALTSSP